MVGGTGPQGCAPMSLAYPFTHLCLRESVRALTVLPVARILSPTSSILRSFPTIVENGYAWGRISITTVRCTALRLSIAIAVYPESTVVPQTIQSLGITWVTGNMLLSGCRGILRLVIRQCGSWVRHMVGVTVLAGKRWARVKSILSSMRPWARTGCTFRLVVIDTRISLMVISFRTAVMMVLHGIRGIISLWFKVNRTTGAARDTMAQRTRRTAPSGSITSRAFAGVTLLMVVGFLTSSRLLQASAV